MQLNLNKNLDLASLTTAYGVNRRGQVPDFLTGEGAEEVAKCLAEDIEWGLFYFAATGGKMIPPEEFQALPQEKKNEIYKFIFQTARDEYQFFYYYYPIAGTYQERPIPEFALHQLFEFLNSEPVLDFIRKLTGIPEIIRCDAQATRYVANCFLHSHTDGKVKEGRRVAYVMNLTKSWQPNWGGYLQFFSDDYNIEQSFMPTFNSLNLFTVPKGHSVSYLPPYCPGQRLSITGWFRDK